MSLILEALRKSEAERRLGQAPDLLAPMPVMHAAREPMRRRSGASAMIVLVPAVGIALAGWWLLRTSPQPAGQPMASSPSHSTDAGTAATATPSTRAERPSIAAMPQQPAATPATVATAPPAAAERVIPRENVARDAAREQPAPHASPARVPATPPRAGESPAAAASIAKQAASIRPVAGAAPGPVVPATPDAAIAAPAPDEPALLPVTALSASDRAGLPSLKVTMHVYDADPARRFMIVDGQRAVEGTPLANGLVLVRIRRDGAEIDAHGRHLLLPNP